MASVDDLGPLLQSLTALKPPGVSKSKIAEINNLCNAHIAHDSAIVDTIANHYNSTPNTHKLGVLYVVDSVTRKWVEKAQQAAQPLIGAAAAPGTFASGIHRMTGVLPIMMNDLIISAPANQKDKVAKLIDIWEQAKTFPEDMLGGFKRRLAGPTQVARSFPSTGTPKPDQSVAKANPAVNGKPPGQGAPLAQNVSFGVPLQQQQQQQPPPPQPAAVPQPGTSGDGAFNQQNFLAAAMQAAMQQPTQAPSSMGSVPNPNMLLQALVTPQIAANFQPTAVVQPAAQQTVAQAPPTVPQVPQLNPQHVSLLQTLVANGVPHEQIAQVVQALGITLPTLPPHPVNLQQPTTTGAPTYQTNNMQAPAPASNQHDYKRSRSRSRSPEYNKRRRVTPPNRRESPVYGVYDPEAARNEANRHQEHDRRGRGRNGRNRRSPPNRPNERQPSPSRVGGASGMQPKFIDFDRSLPKGNIRVLSRTLFVGGVAAPEFEIRNIFSRFGKVQTCIVNMDRRHAFVKMANRADAVRAKEGMERETDPEILNKARSTRWGVGFGPRECSDYSKGESVVPIAALTEADKRWLLTAEYGGTGGKSIEGGMVVEEPDIEIGAGVSSKAISRRIETTAAANKRQDRGHNNRNQGHQQHKPPTPPQQERYGYGYDRGPANAPTRPAYEQPRYREPEQARARQAPQPILKPEPNTVGVPPAVPGFGFQLPGVNLNLR